MSKKIVGARRGFAIATRPGNSSATLVADPSWIELKMIKNDQQEQTSFDEVSLLYVGLLRMLGLLPFNGRDYDFLGTRVLLFVFLSTGVIDWSMLFGYGYNMRKVTVGLVCEVVMVLGIHTRYYVIIKRRAKLLAMMQECRAIWHECINEEGRRTVSVFERKLRVLLMLLLGSGSGITVLYTGNALVHRLPPLEPNGTQHRMLPHKWYWDNAEEHWPGYWIIFFIQQMVVNCAVLITTACDTASPFFMTMISGYFRYLADYFYSRVEPKSDCADRDHDELMRHAELHQRLLTFCKELEQFGRMIFFIQILTTGYNLSLAGIMIIGSDPDKYKYVAVLLMCFFQLLLCQWAPDKLITESADVATAAYFSSTTWTKSRAGKLLVLVIARAQHPVQMTAGGVFTLSLERFGSMMTSAFSFFTILRNLNL